MPLITTTLRSVIYLCERSDHQEDGMCVDDSSADWDVSSGHHFLVAHGQFVSPPHRSNGRLKELLNRSVTAAPPSS